MKKYLTFFRTAFQIALQYKFDFFMWMVYGVIQIFLYFFLWKAIFENQASIHGFTLQSMVSYIIAATVVQIFQPVWHWGEIAHQVSTGDIIFELVKPYNLLIRYYFTEMGVRIFNILVVGGPFLLISYFVLGMQGPDSIGMLLIAALSVFLSTLISYSVWAFVGLSAFYITRVWGVYTTFDGAMLFLTGMLIPLDFMPDWLRTTLEWLPFKDIIYTPISIYLGRIPAAELPLTLGIQAAWAVILAAGIWLYYQHGLKKIVIQGG